MKRLSGPRKTPSNLSESIHQRLNTYALAAGAAGVSVLALAQPSEAKIVYTPANIRINYKTILDLNHDGIKDFAFSTSYFFSTSYVAQNLRIIPHGRNQILGEKGLARALPVGVRVGGVKHFSRQSSFMARVEFNSRNGHSRFDGDWANGGKGVKNRYLGLKFLINGKVHYGWARLNVTITSSHVPQGKLTGYAYETIPNKAIVTGKTMGPDQIIEGPDATLTAPTPSGPSLCLLAMGSPGLSIWRREESVLEGNSLPS